MRTVYKEEGFSTGTSSELSREWVRQTLRDYPYATRLRGLPDDVIVDRVISVARNRENLGAALKAMYRDHATPTISWAWFPTVIKKKLQQIGYNVNF